MPERDEWDWTLPPQVPAVPSGDDDFDIFSIEEKVILVKVTSPVNSGLHELNGLLEKGWKVGSVTPAGARDFTSFFVVLVNIIEPENAHV